MQAGNILSEEKYYENAELWDENKIRDLDKKRIEFTAKLIPNDVNSILDVGCGNGIFLNYVQKKRKYSKLHGVDRSDSALKHVKTQYTKASINLLPFKSSEFDLVSSLEVIEHLPIEIYTQSLEEICRVSKKYILISVPNDEDLKKGSIECPMCRTKFNNNYHMRNFNKLNIETLLDSYNFMCTGTYYIGKQKEYLFISRLLDLVLKKTTQFPSTIRCPLCGYSRRTLEVDNYQKISPDENILITSMKKVWYSLFKKIWPTKSKDLWLIALFEKKP